VVTLTYLYTLPTCFISKARIILDPTKNLQLHHPLDAPNHSASQLERQQSDLGLDIAQYMSVSHYLVYGIFITAKLMWRHISVI